MEGIQFEYVANVEAHTYTAHIRSERLQSHIPIACSARRTSAGVQKINNDDDDDDATTAAFTDITFICAHVTNIVWHSSSIVVYLLCVCILLPGTHETPNGGVGNGGNVKAKVWNTHTHTRGERAHTKNGASPT